MMVTLRNSVRKHALVAFFILAYAFTWAGSLIYVFGIDQASLLTLPGAVVWYYGPALAAILITTLAEGALGVRNLLKRLLQWRLAWRWYAFIVGYPLAFHLAVVGICWLLGGPVPTFFSSALPALPGEIGPVGQPIPALDQLHQSPCKAGRWCSIDHVVVEDYGQVEDLTRLNPAIHNDWLP